MYVRAYRKLNSENYDYLLHCRCFYVFVCVCVSKFELSQNHFEIFHFMYWEEKNTKTGRKKSC